MVLDIRLVVLSGIWETQSSQPSVQTVEASSELVSQSDQSIKLVVNSTLVPLGGSSCLNSSV